MKRRRKLQPLTINPPVVDLSHHNDIADFGKVKASGIAGIIHKATEAAGFAERDWWVGLEVLERRAADVALRAVPRSRSLAKFRHWKSGS
jgi:GH25 family lysozyme M1 (1,4-beta-N-acetylmuramidase)